MMSRDDNECGSINADAPTPLFISLCPRNSSSSRLKQKNRPGPKCDMLCWSKCQRQHCHNDTSVSHQCHQLSLSPPSSSSASTCSLLSTLYALFVTDLLLYAKCVWSNVRPMCSGVNSHQPINHTVPIPNITKCRPNKSNVWTLFRFLVIVLLFANSGHGVDALKRRSPLHSNVIEEVEAKRLEKLIQEQDFIAVFFCE